VNADVAYGNSTLADGIRSRFIDNSNGLSMHILEAGFDRPGRPCVLLLHGFPELAYSWRHILLPLADAGYHVIAPDQRGYGRTTGWDPDYDGDLASYRMLNLVQDVVGLSRALGYDRVAAVIGHDFGSPVASWCALTRPDIFRSVVMMSSPFGGPPSPACATQISRTNIHDELAELKPPRKHYQQYYSTRDANTNMEKCPQGIHDFLRAYYHFKSADWAQNAPHPLSSWTAAAIAELPRYYVMDLEPGMVETVALEMPSAQHISDCSWLPDGELAVYSGEYRKNGFQGGLQWYRCAALVGDDLRAFSGQSIDIPACYIAGERDWGTYQKPGSFERMQTSACTQMEGVHLIERAGHWVQQEQPLATARLLTGFLTQHE
jgi:pimeloyl-ACP methyl ester carboxylesterase